MTQEKNTKFKIKKNDKVCVIAGKDRGKTGNIKKVISSENKVLVEGVNMVTRAQKIIVLMVLSTHLMKEALATMMTSSNTMKNGLHQEIETQSPIPLVMTPSIV